MNELGAKFARIPLVQKIGLLVVLLGGLGAGYYFFVWDEQVEKKASLEKQIENIEREKNKLKVIAKEKAKFEKRLEELEDRRKKALAFLPEDAQFEELTVDFNRRARQAQIRIPRIDQLPEVPSGFFSKVPAELLLEGTFHQLVIFFNLIAEMKRIVNIENVSFLEPKRRDGQVYLRARARATSYRSNNQPVPAAAPPPPPPRTGLVEKGTKALKKSGKRGRFE